MTCHPAGWAPPECTWRLSREFTTTLDSAIELALLKLMTKIELLSSVLRMTERLTCTDSRAPPLAPATSSGRASPPT